jgi:hypothetical protein
MQTPMRVFIDESGSFSWKRPGWSIVAAVGIRERGGALEAVIKRLLDFERSLPKERRTPGGEVKGASLTDRELATFVWDVLPRDRAITHASLVGFDTSRTAQHVVRQFRTDLEMGCAPEGDRYAARRDRRMAQVVSEAATWIHRRSEQEVGWLLALHVAIADALTHAVVGLLGVEHDDGLELAALSYVIDRSSRIRGKREEYIWRQVLNSGLCAYSRAEPFPAMRQWPQDHPFLAKYWRGNGFDFRELWREVEFGDSQQTPGLRIADLVAQIAVRHFMRDEAHSAWSRLRGIVMGPNGRKIHAIRPSSD